MSMVDNLRETVPYKCYKRYYDNFYTKSNLEAVLKECWLWQSIIICILIL